MKNELIFFTSAFCGLATNALAEEQFAMKNGKSHPNVIIIFTDDQGYGDVGCFGSHIKTPNIDNMALKGMRFTDFYAGANVSTPSRAALMTGCYPPRVNMPNVIFPENPTCLNPNELTLAEMFQSAGYHTGIVGKWHLGAKGKGLPIHHGFNEFYGLPYSHDMVNSAFKGFVSNPNKKLDRDYSDLPLYQNEKIIELNPDPASLTTRYTEYCTDFIKRNKETPFFLYLAHNMPHVPLAVSKEREGTSGCGLYGDVITEIDWSIGQIYEALRKNGLENNTLVVYASDNGPWLLFGNHGGSAGELRAGKGTTFDGGHRVFCLMTWPGVVPAGRVCSEVATTMDILPTMANYIGVTLSNNKIDGKDIMPLMQGKNKAVSPHDSYYYFKSKKAFAVRCGDWKLILPHLDPEVTMEGKDGLRGEQKPVHTVKALYNLRTDKGEKINLIKKYPKKVAEMERKIQLFNREIETQNRPCGIIE